MIDRVAPGSRVVRAEALLGGLSATTTALELARSDGSTQRVVVRRPGSAQRPTPSAAQHQFATLQAVRAMGLPAPDPLALETSSDPLGSPFIVLDFIEGEPDFAPADLDAYCAQLARQLAAIHNADRSRIDLSHLPQIPNACAELEQDRSPVADVRVAEEEIRALLQSDWPHAVNPPVLLHGDYWPGNVLWRDNKLAAVIDWEDAALGDPLSELANARLELRWILGAEATQAFTAHYQAALPVHDLTDYSNLPYWDLCAALHLIHHAADWDTWAEPLPSDGRDVTASTIARDLADFVDRARAQIEDPGAEYGG